MKVAPLVLPRNREFAVLAFNRLPAVPAPRLARQVLDAGEEVRRVDAWDLAPRGEIPVLNADPVKIAFRIDRAGRSENQHRAPVRVSYEKFASNFTTVLLSKLCDDAIAAGNLPLK
jgi:hypothetical protein